MTTKQNHQPDSEQFKGDWIQTYSGIKFYPLNPNLNDILIADIAHALSMICRFNGHTKKFYSVAEHSYWVSKQIKDPAVSLAALLHDASEAYICDIPRPLKNTPEFQVYRDIEFILQMKIWDKFGVSDINRWDKQIKEWDIKVWVQESRDLMSPLHPEYIIEGPGLKHSIQPMGPEEAEFFFLRQFKKLIRQINKQQES